MHSTTVRHRTPDVIHPVDNRESATDTDQLLPSSTDQKVNTVSRGKFGDFVTGLIKSRIVRSLLLAGASIGILFLIVSNPVGWLIATVFFSTLILSLALQLPCKGLQKMRFELSAFIRLFKKNYHEIVDDTNSTGIILGALPNRLSSYGEKLVNKKNVGAVLSINEPWERTPYGLSAPYTQADWEDLGVEYKKIDARDHTLLSVEDLKIAADWIHDQITDDRRVYVHCRGGVGRSAMAVAAYLIKYRINRENKEPEEIVAEVERIILTSRPCSTIRKKKTRLIDFVKSPLSSIAK